MKKSVALAVLGVSLFALPVCAAQKTSKLPDYPDRAESVSRPTTLMNFNLSTRTRTKADFPQGRNADEQMTVRSESAPVKPRKPVCVGNDCGCASGRMK